MAKNDEKYSVKLAKFLRDERRAQGLSQKQLAKKINVSGSYVGYLENNKRRGNIDLIKEWAEALGLEFELNLKRPQEQQE